MRRPPAILTEHPDQPGRSILSSGAEAIITGDLDLLAIDPDQLAVEVITPRQFVARLSDESAENA